MYRLYVAFLVAFSVSATAAGPICNAAEGEARAVPALANHTDSPHPLPQAAHAAVHDRRPGTSLVE